MNSLIQIAAAVIRDRQGRVLLVRKRGTTAFMQPGGKIDPNEDGLAALAREVQEELGCSIRSATARFLGRFTAAAANEVGETVIADLYGVEVDGDPKAAAEIEELAWIHVTAPGEYLLAPLTREHVLPLLQPNSHGESCV
jgi:8-oxo-dGTP pyrophosphatase MutT (NUDIX family)